MEVKELVKNYLINCRQRGLTEGTISNKYYRLKTILAIFR